MDAKKPYVIIIAGPNGAGKSTLAPFLLRDTFNLLEYVNADTIALGLSAFNPEGVAFEAGRVMLQRLRNLATQREDFAFESTLASRFYARWITELHRQGYNFHLLFLWLRSADLAVRRVKERVHLGGHDVPEEVVLRRYRKGLCNFSKLYKPLADTWTVYDNSSSNAPLMLATGNRLTVLAIYQANLWQQFCEASDESGN